MSHYNFLAKPIDAIIFDCDGTLSHIEGIDELAKARHVDALVSKLTAEAMEKTGLTSQLYQRRLDLVQPTQEQVTQLGLTYFEYRAPDSREVIHLLQKLGKVIYIVSAGLLPAVLIFAERLQIPKQNIYAVPIYFNGHGHYRDFDHQSPLIQSEGKRQIVNTLKAKHEELLYVGDGMNDYSVYDLVSRFVGYGGAFYREKFAAQSEYYITKPTFKPLLPLCLTQAEFDSLRSDNDIFNNLLK